MKPDHSIIYPLSVPTNYRVSMLVSMPYAPPVWMILWYLLLFKYPPQDSIFEVIAIDKAKISLKFLYLV